MGHFRRMGNTLRMKSSAAKETVEISKLKLDPHNANKGTVRGRRALQHSLKEFGAGRSILIDKDGTVIAGNKTLEQAIARGDKEVQVIKTDGSKLVAVQRTDLSLKDPKAKALAIADNRVSELDLSWDPAELSQLGADVKLGQFFTDEELGELLTDVPQLVERETELKPKRFVRVLLSVPIEKAVEAKGHIDELAKVEGIEIDYSAN
jgi:hypothetical protein